MTNSALKLKIAFLIVGKWFCFFFHNHFTVTASLRKCMPSVPCSKMVRCPWTKKAAWNGRDSMPHAHRVFKVASVDSRNKFRRDSNESSEELANDKAV